MNYLSLDRDIIDKHFQKKAKIFFELGGDINLKQAFVLSLPKMLAGRIMIIIEDKYRSVTASNIGCIRQAIFCALDDIFAKGSAMKQIVKNDPALDIACCRSDLITGKKDCSCQAPRKKLKNSGCQNSHAICPGSKGKQNTSEGEGWTTQGKIEPVLFVIK